MMSEPLDLGSIRDRVYVSRWATWGDAINDFDALLAEVDRLRAAEQRVRDVLDETEWGEREDPAFVALDRLRIRLRAALDGKP